jgi:hypothetical protein
MSIRPRALPSVSDGDPKHSLPTSLALRGILRRVIASLKVVAEQHADPLSPGYDFKSGWGGGLVCWKVRARRCRRSGALWDGFGLVEERGRVRSF